MLLRAYASGVFPMSESANSDEIFWVDPKTRGIIPLDGLHISRSMRKFIRKMDYAITVDSCFSEVLAHCADREETWINDEISELYRILHNLGYAHSLEVWDGNRQLIGGLYGVSLGGAFFGESMFSTATNASKIALIWLVARLNAGGYKLLDTQFITSHLTSLGAIEISRDDYHSHLDAALDVKATFMSIPENAPIDQVLQLSTQTS
jgi:leucyl/phenylalanyl-tRNA--protein transferase